MGAWTTTFMIGVSNRNLCFSQSTLYVKYTTIFPIYQKISLKKIFGLLVKSEKSTFCTGNRIRTYNCMASKTTAYAKFRHTGIFAERVRFELTDL